MTELAGAIREAALLEGDFVLRSGRRSNYYLDKYRFSTRPDLLRALGAAIAEAVREHEPDAVRLAAPELGAVPLAAAASLEAGLPFVIVRGAAKAYGTGNRIEGPFARGRPRSLDGRLRGRPRGGRRRRPRARRRPAAAPLLGLGGQERSADSAWLSHPMPLLGSRPRSARRSAPQPGGSFDEAGVHPEGRSEERSLEP
jgi:hypothetical protein